MNWRDTVSNTKTQNPGISFKEVLRKAGETYRNSRTEDTKKTLGKQAQTVDRRR